MNTEIKVIEKEIVPVAKSIEAIVIINKEDMVQATTLLSNINRYGDMVQIEKDKIVKPAFEALKAARAHFKPAEDKVSDAVTVIKDKMTSYQLEVEAAAKIAEEKISNRVKAGKGNLSLETAITKINQIDHAEVKVATEAGSVQFISVKKFEVVNLSELPVEYILPNEVAIRQAMKDGKELPGVRYYEDKQVRNSR